MIDEVNALTINETWELVPPYPSQNVVAILSIVLSHGTLVLKRLSLLCPPWNISSLMIAPFS
ncbi:hypothetical protein AAG906_018366 [Vitis piasezkii]